MTVGWVLIGTRLVHTRQMVQSYLADVLVLPGKGVGNSWLMVRSYLADAWVMPERFGGANRSTDSFLSGM